MSILNQRSFTGGEVAPSLYARVDTAKYQNGARTMRNFEVMRHGGAQNRPGSKYIVEVKDSTKTVRLVPFVFNDSQTYVLEFGDGYIRFIQDGAQVGPGTPAAWANTTAYVAGDLVSYSGVNYWCRQDHTSATANDRPSTGTNWQSYWYAMPAGVLEAPTPYGVADLPTLKWTQSADVMTFTHYDYPVHTLARRSSTQWAFKPMLFRSTTSIPTGVTNDGATVQPQQTITGITAANPAVVSVVAHGLSTGDTVQLVAYWRFVTVGTYGTYIQNFNTSFNGAITNTGANTFTIVEQGQSASWNTTSFSTATFLGGYIVKTGTSAATLYRTQYVVTAVDSNGLESEPSIVTGTSATPTSAAAVNISWTSVSGISKYNVYKNLGAVFGFIGTATRPLFTDNGITPDSTLTAPFSDLTIFQAADDYPSCVGYYQQRLWFGASTNEPETAWASRTGDFSNFSKRQPLQDDDSIKFNLSGRQVAEVKHIMDLGKLLVFASTGEYFCNGDAAGIVTPTDVNIRQHSNYGSSDLPPIQIGNNAIFVQARGSIVRDLGFDWQTEGYKGNDLTIFAAHLFDGYTLADWAYQKVPHSIVWAVRDDGTLLGLTYLPEHQIWGWHRHDTDGTYENVCVVPEGGEDSLYVVVNRDGGRYIERFASRQVDQDDTTTWKFLDSYATYDGRHTGSTTMTLTGSGWTYTDSLTLTASASTFVAGDVGNQFWLTGSDGTVIRCTVTAYTSATVVTVLPHKTVPVAMRAVAITTWTKAVDEVSGLDHLEGKDVAVFADGFVVASPNNSAYTTVTVTSGAITLDKPYGVIHVGLPYLCDLETLDIDTIQGETMVDKRKRVNEVWVYTEASRGLFAGASEPTDTATTELNELKKRSSESYDSPVSLSTGVESIIIRPEWNSHGRVFLRQVDPLPLAILAVAPKGDIPLRG